MKRILLIAAGPSVIGQGAEFDYSGTQAAYALRELGHEVVVLNSNPASILTDKESSNSVYIETINLENIVSIIRREKITSILGNFGGQTALNMVLELQNNNIFDEYNLELLANSIETIENAEDREKFRNLLDKIDQPYVDSMIVNTETQARQALSNLKLPLIVRPAFTLGGSGGGRCKTEKEFFEIVKQGLNLSPVHQCLIEKDISGLKEFEFEMIRDSSGEVLSVCSLENFDPVGIHTGDSVIFSPVQTLNKKQIEILDKAAKNIVSELKILGSCNVQFAFDAKDDSYYVIEVNPRVSRSSALASKISNYPIAKISALIAAGLTLKEIKQEYKPIANYVASKMPRFPFDKFKEGNRRLGTQMKSTGEIMAFGLNLEEAMFKGLESLEFEGTEFAGINSSNLLKSIEEGNDLRFYQIIELLKRGVSSEEVALRSKIDIYFIDAIHRMNENQSRYLSGHYNFFNLDKNIYFTTSHDHENILKKEKESIVVLGSGPIRIGQGMEFDYSTVQAIQTIKEMGYEAVVINNNPATVSTDSNIADRLYFEPLVSKRVLSILEFEKPKGVILQFGGQTAINLATIFADAKIPILGTRVENMNKAEDREQFEKVLKKLKIKQPQAHVAHNKEDFKNLADKITYPVLIRPSFVIGGAAMKIVKNEKDYLKEVDHISFASPVLIDRYISGVELDLDIISDSKNIMIPGLMEHIERSGVHSGDSMAVYPSQSINQITKDRIIKSCEEIAKELKIIGLMNIQMIVHDNEVYVIEVNPRSSRTIPFISKASGLEISKIATKVILGEKLSINYGLVPSSVGVHIKAPVFSFSKLRSVDTYLGPEMKSTGEIMSSALNLDKALFKAFTSSDYKFKDSGHVLLTIANKDKEEVIDLARKIDALDYDILASENTHILLKENNIASKCIAKVGESEKDMIWAIQNIDINFIVNTVSDESKAFSDGFLIRRTAVEHGIPLFTSIDTAKALVRVLESRSSKPWRLGGKQ